MKKWFFLALCLPLTLALGLPLVAVANESLDAPAPDGVRPGGTLSQEFSPPMIPRELSQGRRSPRNYPEQPPTIPHTIRDYQIDKNFNQCLNCHSRNRTPESGAPMVSITHFWDRDNQALAAVSPRRYFCLQCHVVQHDVPPVVGNDFQSIDSVLQKNATGGAE